MSITEEQEGEAKELQDEAAHSTSSEVRLIAGPGTGKSFAIQERVLWLINNGTTPENIFVVSFTRASTLDLGRRIIRYCEETDEIDSSPVNVSTLHSLALGSLSSAGLLAYPVNPLVMDDWELRNIFDPEFSRASGFRRGISSSGYTIARCKLIRRDYEAFCGTGTWMPANYIQPTPPISGAERSAYRAFHVPRTLLYACVLPGEIIRQCIENMNAGVLDPIRLLGIEQLIVDEYQDLNPTDLEFIDWMINHGVNTFIAGDDDQSLYSFRFASPDGLRSFNHRFPNTSDFELRYCFRCTSDVLSAAQSLLAKYSELNRIPKQLSSLYEASNPPESGIVFRWRFRSGVQEARAIAKSCASLIKLDFNPEDMMILLSNTRILLSLLIDELETAGVPYESPRSDSFIDSREGRFAHAILRVVCDQNDYVAHRLILGLPSGVGSAACNDLAQATITSNLNFQDVFYQPLPSGVFHGRAVSALKNARNVCALLAGWSPVDTVDDRLNDIADILINTFGKDAAEGWYQQLIDLPQLMTLKELRDYFWADTDEQRAALLANVHVRLEIHIPDEGLLPQKVRIMTMHGAKGLSSKVVFIPGLEENIIPSTKNSRVPGLILEAARMLYVSITRARAACILSYSSSRVKYGSISWQRPSRFSTHLGGQFSERTNSLQDDEISRIVEVCSNL